MIAVTCHMPPGGDCHSTIKPRIIEDERFWVLHDILPVLVCSPPSAVCDVAVVVDRQNSIWSECSVGGVLRGAGAAVHVPSGSAADTAVSDRTTSCTVRCSESRCCHTTAKCVLLVMSPDDSWRPSVLLLCFLVFSHFCSRHIMSEHAHRPLQSISYNMLGLRLHGLAKFTHTLDQLFP